MTDLALAAAPVITPVVSTAVVAAAASVAGEVAADPFAALLAAMAPSPDAAAPVNPTAMPVPIAPPGTTAKTPVLAVTPDEQAPVAKHDGDQTNEPSDEDTADADQSDDPELAMMLAIATPALVAPAIVPLPVDAKAPSPAPAITASAKAAALVAKDMADAGNAAPVSDSSDIPAAQATPLQSSRFAMLAARLMGGTTPTQTAKPEAAQIAARTLTALKADVLQPASMVPLQSAAAQMPAAPVPSTVDAKIPAAAREIDRTDIPASAPDPTGALFASPVLQSSAPADPVAASRAPDTAIHRELSMAHDGQWLDTLARDIAAAAGKDGQMSFRLDPRHLGSLTVHISHSQDGASIRMSADTEAARQMLSDAQPRLAAEARAQGLHLRETSVDLGGSGAHQSGQQGAASAFAQGQSQRDSGGNQTFINLDVGEVDEPARTLSTSARSDLYA